MLVCLCVVRVLCVCCVCVLCVLCVRLSFVLFPFSLWFFPLRLLPPGGASSWTLTARRSRCLFGRLGWAALCGVGCVWWLCVRLSFVLFPFSLWFFPLRPLPPGGASSWTLTARRLRWSPEKDEACSDDEHDLNTMEGCANWMLCMFLPKKQGPAAAFGRILLAEHPDAKGRQSQPLVCRVHPNRCERQVVAHKA